jgi:hypothetical protein
MTWRLDPDEVEFWSEDDGSDRPEKQESDEQDHDDDDEDRPED